MRRFAALVLLVLAAVVVLRRRLARAPALSPVPARPKAALPAPPSFLSVPWTLVEAPGDAAELAIRAEIAEPLTLDRVDVQETPTQVFVTVLARPAAGVEQAAGDGAATVALSRPLGERELVHAPADPPLYP